MRVQLSSSPPPKQPTIGHRARESGGKSAPGKLSSSLPASLPFRLLLILTLDATLSLSFHRLVSPHSLGPMLTPALRLTQHCHTRPTQTARYFFRHPLPTLLQLPTMAFYSERSFDRLLRFFFTPIRV
uniref:Uncharacterized protein n=1 Tax=Plectus sambesii TaxID=2011161 RepID=A0A914WAT7_9BILA